jgi:hypothetical protein
LISCYHEKIISKLKEIGNMKAKNILCVAMFVVAQQAAAIEVTVETAKQAAELAGVKVPDSVNTAATLLGGSSNTTTGVAASALAGGNNAGNLGAAAALAGGNNSGALGSAAALAGSGGSNHLGTAAGVLTGTTSPTDAAAIALGVKKEPTAEEKAADALKGLIK